MIECLNGSATGPWKKLQAWIGALLVLFLIASGVPVYAAVADATDATDETEEVGAKSVPETVRDLEEIEARVAAVVEKATPATVSVRSGGGSGSGVIISEDGYVLTAGHVASKPGRSVTVVFPDGKTARGVSLGINVGIDAGLMKITDKGEWPHMEMGDMAKVKPGSWVVAMGHPGGFDIDRPMVARLGRVYRVRSSVIQTDCTIIGGDSGGPLFDLDGKVIGIHSRISTSLRQNFHVPITMYTDGWDRLAAGEVWNRPLLRGGARPGGPFIGVKGVSRIELGNGAELEQVYRDTPADRAGLRSGDVVVEFDRAPIGSFGDLVEVVGRMEPGEKAKVIVERDGERLEMEIVIGKNEGGE